MQTSARRVNFPQVRGRLSFFSCTRQAWRPWQRLSVLLRSILCVLRVFFRRRLYLAVTRLIRLRVQFERGPIVVLRHRVRASLFSREAGHVFLLVLRNQGDLRGGASRLQRGRAVVRWGRAFGVYCGSGRAAGMGLLSKLAGGL